MADTERDGALLSPPALRAVVLREVTEKGIRPWLVVGGSVTPRREPGRPNKVLDRRQDRWVADCPNCPGAEVVPASGLFLCGSCGAQANVDWEGS